MSALELARDVARRRTFAIISHPDAGKTTLTEKLLLFGGAILLAGTVKARKSARHATSDWMEVEKQRGISVTSSVMQFEYAGHVINLLDTPGHQDFSEDTYRVLTAVDAVVMVIDAAKGVEAQTIKLLEVCRLRNTPIITFVNKLDREVRPPVELLEEIESVLHIDCAPVTWPLGMGKVFRGVFHLHTKASDGINTLEEMVEGAIALGLEYLGVSDHSQTAVYAHGLDEKHVMAQKKEIEKLQKKYPNFKIFHGIESDILADGSLDFDAKGKPSETAELIPWFKYPTKQSLGLTVLYGHRSTLGYYNGKNTIAQETG